MKAVKYLAVVLLGIFITSCDDSIDNHDQLTMGNESGMKITNYDEIIQGNYNVTNNFPIDIDDNGIADFQISCEVWGSPAVGQHPRSYIKSLNSDFQLYGDYTNDTIFLNFSILSNPGTYYTIMRYHQYSCSRIEENDSIYSITSTFKTPPLVKGNKIKKDHYFESTNVQLMDESFSLVPQPYSENNDTIVGVIYRHNLECNNFPIGSIVYIGFKDQKKSKLGWIKFSYHDKNLFKLLETAIQK